MAVVEVEFDHCKFGKQNIKPYISLKQFQILPNPLSKSLLLLFWTSDFALVMHSHAREHGLTFFARNGCIEDPVQNG